MNIMETPEQKAADEEFVRSMTAIFNELIPDALSVPVARIHSVDYPKRDESANILVDMADGSTVAIYVIPGEPIHVTTVMEASKPPTQYAYMLPAYER